MDKITQQRIASCKALQGKTIRDICETQLFMYNLEHYMKAQFDDRKAIKASYEAMKKAGGAKDYGLPAHVIDQLTEMTVEDFAAEYMSIQCKHSIRPMEQRKFIRQLAQQAYNLTVAEMVVIQFPDLEPELIPTKNKIGWLKKWFRNRKYKKMFNRKVAIK